MVGKVIFAGHSHLSAIAKAYKEKEVKPLDARFLQLKHKAYQPNFVVEKKIRLLSPELKKRLKHVVTKENPELVFGVFMGNEYNSLAMVKPPVPFTLDESSIEGSYIPEELMLAHLTALVERNAGLFIRSFRDIYKGRMVSIPPPPPIESADYILAHGGNFAERAKENGLNEPALRLKMWTLYCEALKCFNDLMDVETFELPSSVFSNGFLADKFLNDDPTHGNVLYGDVLLEEISRKFNV